MPDANVVLTALRNELEAAGLVRRPGAAGAAPPIYIEPSGGAPAPGERDELTADDNVVVTLRLSTTTRSAPGRRVDVVDLIYRSRGTAGLKRGRELDAAIVERLADGASYGVGILLGASGTTPVFALAVDVFAGIGPLSDDAGIRTDLAKLALEVLTA